MFEVVNGETVAAEVQMTRAGSTKPIIIFEGDCDSYFYPNLFIDTNVEFVIAHGKENAIDCVNILNEEGGVSEYLAIVDSDFDKLLGIIPPANVLESDFHDYEIGIVFSNANIRICKEYVSDKVKKHVKILEDISVYLCKKLYPLSIFRFINKTKYNVFCFKNMDFSKFIDKSKLDIDNSKMVKQVMGITIANRKAYGLDISNLPSEKDVVADICSTLSKSYRFELITNGHDYLCLFSYALHKAIATVEPKIANEDNMAKVFRLAYSRDDFCSTELYTNITNWQVGKGQIII